MTNEELHPWKWFAPANSKALIVGTFPTAKHNWSYDFFYPNVNNLFWKVMANVAQTELLHFAEDEAVEERKNILSKLQLAVTDMGYKVIRNDNSSSDEKLLAVEYMSIFKILDENPGINKIILTSSSKKVNAVNWFENYLIQQNRPQKMPKGPKPVYTSFNYSNKEIEVAILKSTSKAAGIKLPALVDLYKKEII